MPKIKVSDIEVYYEAHGDGFPLLMILGLESNIDWWGRSLIRKLSEYFRVIIFDNRGTGKSDAPDADFTLSMLIEDTIGLMDALNIEQSNIFGHSMGGRIAQGLALNYPERINKLVLCSASCGVSNQVPVSPEVLNILQSPRETLAPEQIASNMLSIFYTKEFLRAHPKFVEIATLNMTKIQTSNESYKRQLKAINDFDTCNKLKNLHKPTCIMHGLKDRLVPFQNGEVLANLIPKAKLIVFKNSAHIPFVEERDKFLTKLISFLKEPF